MEYKYLNQWCLEQAERGYLFSEMRKYQDQYCIVFRKQTLKLQISLASEDSFPFFTKKRMLDFSVEGELAQFNHQLISSKLRSVETINDDRIIQLTFSKTDLSGKEKFLYLILELIPHYTNIILTEKLKGEMIILNALKKFSLAENPQRQILPQVSYFPPETSYNNRNDSVKFPLKINDRNRIVQSTNNEQGFTEINNIFESLFYDHIFSNRLEYKRKQIIKSYRKQEKKKQNKLSNLLQEYENTDLQEQWQQWAELLKGNFNQLRTGMEKIKLIDYYQSQYPEIEIPLKSQLSPNENIEFYFKKFRKARDGKEQINKQITLTKKEIKAIQKQIREIENLELEELLALDLKKKEKFVNRESKYRAIEINQYWEILIGRTSTENDYLTTRLARSWDWWFHTRIFKGTHVILRNFSKKELPDDLKIICCRIAAYYSKAKKSSNVPVDYTQIRYVRKPRKSPPGYVIYTDQKTLFVDPLSVRDAVLALEKSGYVKKEEFDG